MPQATPEELGASRQERLVRARGLDEAAKPNQRRLREREIMGSLARQRRKLEEGAGDLKEGSVQLLVSPTDISARRIFPPSPPSLPPPPPPRGRAGPELGRGGGDDDPGSSSQLEDSLAGCIDYRYVSEEPKWHVLKGLWKPACFWRHIQPGFYQKGLPHLPRDWIYVRSSGGGVKVWHVLRCKLLDLEEAASGELAGTFADITPHELEEPANGGLANLERLDSQRLPTAADEQQQKQTTRIQKELGEMRKKAEDQRQKMMEDAVMENKQRKMRGSTDS